LVHHGGGTTAQLVAFAKEVAAEVERKFGISLAPEPRFVGMSW
jgi:UDP-N-acetylmuramate dehydrogenase